MMSLATLVYSSLVGYLLKDNIAEATADKNDLVTSFVIFLFLSAISTSELKCSGKRKGRIRETPEGVHISASGGRY